MGRKIVVVGGVAGGATAAAKARRQDENAEIIILERYGYVSFANCGLPYYISREAKTRDSLFIATPKKFKDWYNVDVRVNNEVTKINREEKAVEVIDHSTGKAYKESYDKLIVATGGTPLKPPIPGIELKNIHSLWTIADMDGLFENLKDNKAKKAAVIGGGFVGLEIVESLVERGLKVTLIELMDQVLPPFDKDVTLPIITELEEHGVEVVLSDGVDKFLGEGKIEKIELKSGKVIEDLDLAVVAIGVRPNLQILTDAGIEMGETRGVLVNEKMETNDPDIYAAGDICESIHIVSEKKVRIPLAHPANKQGRVAGCNAVGGNMEYKGALGTSIVRTFNVVTGKAGLSEKEALNEGYDFFVSYTTDNQKSGYLPKLQTMITKLIVENKTGRILGAEIVGGEGVDRRVDVFAVAIYGKMTVFDIENIDFAYAPPFGPAKDPALVAAMVASNILRGNIEVISPADLAKKMEVGKDFTLVDNRTMIDIDQGGPLKESDMLLQMDEFREYYQEDLEGMEDEEIVLMCAIGSKSYLGYRILKQAGYKNVKSVSGGFYAYKMKLPNKIKD